jgi:hypothetical protein
MTDMRKQKGPKRIGERTPSARTANPEQSSIYIVKDSIKAVISTVFTGGRRERKNPCISGLGRCSS